MLLFPGTWIGCARRLNKWIFGWFICIWRCAWAFGCDIMKGKRGYDQEILCVHALCGYEMETTFE